MYFRVLTLIIAFVVGLVFVASVYAKKEETDPDGPLTSYVKKEKKRSRVFARASADCSSSRVQTGWLFIHASIPGGGTDTNPRLTHNFSGRVYKRVKADRSGASEDATSAGSSMWARDRGRTSYYSTFASV